MTARVALSFLVVLLCGCPESSTSTPAAEAPEPIGVQLIPHLQEAAGMKNADFDRMASAAAPPAPSDSADQNLTLVLMFGVPVWGEANPEVAFKSLKTKPPSPVELVKVLERTKGSGYVTALHKDDVVSVSGVKDDQGVARGSVTCRNEFYEFTADYVAKIVDKAWVVTEFKVAGVGSVTREPGGNWTCELAPQAPPSSGAANDEGK